MIERLRVAVLRMHIEMLALVIPDASKMVPLRRLLAWFTPRRSSHWYRGIDQRRILSMVQHRLRNPWRMRGRRCLREGLLCYYFLRLIDVPAQLNFGVFTQPRTRELAHCWITVGNDCLTQPPQDDYVTMMQYPKDSVGRAPVAVE